MARAIEFQDPGEGIHEAEVLEILVSAGDSVSEGQQILVVETDKANFEIHAPFGGTVEKVRVSVGDTIEVGDPLLTLDTGSDGDTARSKEARADEGGREPAEASSGEPEDAGTGEEGAEDAEARDREDEDSEEAERADAGEPAEDRRRREAPARRRRGREDDRGARRTDRGRGADDGAPVPASPATRRLARELGVRLREVAGSGEEGRVLPADVRAHAARGSDRAQRRRPRREPPELPDFARFGPVERAPLRSVRRTIARRMVRSWETIPHVTHEDEADVTELEAFRQRQEERLDEGDGALTLTVLVLKACAAVLHDAPRFNASLDDQTEELVYKRYYHLGVATDTPRGLLVPTLRDVDRKSVRDLARELADVTERAREGSLSRDEMAGGTFTITNVGGIGGRYFSPIINHPQVAILGMGRATLEPRVVEGRGGPQIEPRRILPLSLGFDHRVVDGADAARFTNRLIEILADPEWFAVTT